MNLHIVPDHTFSNRFYANLVEAGVIENNRLVVRTNAQALKHVKHDVPFAKLYSRAFNEIVGRTEEYEQVFIHQFTPLLYRWVATNKFTQLNWMVWGADLYNLPFIQADLYEPLTHQFFSRRHLDVHSALYHAKVWLLHARFRNEAYSRVNSVFTWMKSEYDFARQNLPSLSAGQQFFFYENDLPYHALDNVSGKAERREKPLYIVGNSATPELNHLDAIRLLEELKVSADLIVPVSYGNMRYAAFLQKAQPEYRHGRICYVKEYMAFDDYLRILASADGLVMNNIRPQGYGNIFMMMYLGKSVYLNPHNLSIPDVERAGLTWYPLNAIEKPNSSTNALAVNRTNLLSLLSHESLIALYKQIFGSR